MIIIKNITIFHKKFNNQIKQTYQVNITPKYTLTGKYLWLNDIDSVIKDVKTLLNITGYMEIDSFIGTKQNINCIAHHNCTESDYRVLCIKNFLQN